MVLNKVHKETIQNLSNIFSSWKHIYRRYRYNALEGIGMLAAVLEPRYDKYLNLLGGVEK